MHSHLVHMIEYVEDVVGQTAQQVDNKPTPQVILSDYVWIAYDL